MSESTPGTVAFVFYVLLFGWIGFRRGLFRELTVLIVSVGGFFLLQQNQGLALDIVRQLLGLLGGIIVVGAKLLAALRAGGAGTEGEPVHTLSTSDWLSDADQPTVSFLVWAGVLLLTYILTNKTIPRQPELVGNAGGAARNGQRSVLHPDLRAAAVRFHPGARGRAGLGRPAPACRGLLAA